MSEHTSNTPSHYEPTGPLDAPSSPEGSEDFEYDDDPGCMTCQGDGWEECEDSDNAEGCWAPDCTGTVHTCPNCLGSGNAKDQRFW